MCLLIFWCVPRGYPLYRFPLSAGNSSLLVSFMSWNNNGNNTTHCVESHINVRVIKFCTQPVVFQMWTICARSRISCAYYFVCPVNYHYKYMRNTCVCMCVCIVLNEKVFFFFIFTFFLKCAKENQKLIIAGRVFDCFGSGEEIGVLITALYYACNNIFITQNNRYSIFLLKPLSMF